MKMILPADWDEPSEGNAQLCDRFLKRSIGINGGYLPYRIYEPEISEEESVPLVVYLHGADAAGDDNDLQLSMHDIGTCLIRDEMQRRHPCYVLAPQYGEMKHWSMQNIKDGLYRLIDDTAAKYVQADRNRIYVYGYSAGGVGVLRLIKERPGYFAAAVSVCGATGSLDIDNLLRTPLWMIHAVDDNIVKASYRTGQDRGMSNFGSHDIYEWYLDHPDRKSAQGGGIKYTEYPEGYMKEHYGVNPHCSWVALSDKANGNIWEWMFSHKLGSGIM